jgi:hypothetical protein
MTFGEHPNPRELRSNGVETPVMPVAPILGRTQFTEVLTKTLEIRLRGPMPGALE